MLTPPYRAYIVAVPRAGARAAGPIFEFDKPQAPDQDMDQSFFIIILSSKFG